MRRIDNKFSVNGDQIIKTANGEAIPEDEPLFIVRARDWLAVPLLEMYAILSKVDGFNDYHFDKLQTSIQVFKDFSEKYPERMKQPSVTRGL